ncbi:MAG TPA: IPT/TIG domain-containing protein [Solirubrobacteraceae bacterium]|nr:IPT/TIG domain-containing protein [Solirubrobacteraceae bacterium]
MRLGFGPSPRGAGQGRRATLLIALVAAAAVGAVAAVLLAPAGGRVRAASPPAAGPIVSLSGGAPGAHAGYARGELTGQAALARLHKLPAQAQSTISASVGAGSRAYAVRRSGDGYRLQGGGVRGQLDAHAIELHAAGGSLSMALRGLGRGARLRSPAAFAASAHANRVTYAGAGLAQWYAAGPLGLEQGFTLARRPAGGAAPLTFALALGGSLHAVKAGSEVRFLTSTGKLALRYGGLSATDARGHHLPVSMQLRGQRLLVHVSDRGARYPLHIDPLIQQGEKITASGEEGEGGFGFSVALSADGDTAIVGAPAEAGYVGSAWVFTRTGSTWTQQGGKLTGAEESGPGEFGYSVALSSDGDTALVSGAGDAGGTGAVWVFTRTGTSWSQQGEKLTGGGESGKGDFGFHVALSSDGDTALIGGVSDDNLVGAAWVFTRAGTSWSQQGEKLTGEEESGEGEFGYSVALSGDGRTALIGGPTDNGGVGAAWAFTRAGGGWSEQGEKLTGAEESGAGEFGFSEALSSDGDSALIGGAGDEGSVGAAWLFTRSGGGFSQQGEKLRGGEESGNGQYGFDVALSSDGETGVVSGPNDNHAVGAAWFLSSEPHGGLILSGYCESLGYHGYEGGSPVILLKGEVAGPDYAYENWACQNEAGETATIAATGPAPSMDDACQHENPGLSTYALAGDENNAFSWACYLIPPKVSSIEPASGLASGGTEVTIKGSGFVEGASVNIGGEAQEVHVLSETEITATTPASEAGGYEVVVADGNGTSSAGPTYTYTEPVTVTSLEPGSGERAGGNEVTIHGSGFAPGASVSFGGSPGTEVDVSSSTTLTALAPSGTGTVNVRVTVGGETSPETFSDRYSYVPSGQLGGIDLAGYCQSLGYPGVTLVKPNFEGEAGDAYENWACQESGGHTVIIATSGPPPSFENACVALYHVAAYGYPADEENADSWACYRSAQPVTVESIAPSSGPTGGGQEVTIKGTGFVEGAKVKLGKTGLKSVRVVSETEIKGRTAAGEAGAHEVSVKDEKGTSSAGPAYTYATGPALPIVKSVKASSGPSGGGQVVTIKGSGFLAPATVHIGSEAAEVTVLSETELEARTVATAPGEDEVLVSDANGVSSGGPAYTYVSAPALPIVRSVSPAGGPTGGGQLVTIKGSGFQAGAKVKIGKSAGAVDVISETEIEARTAAGEAGADEVQVSDENGRSMGGPSYTYTAGPAVPIVKSVSPSSGSHTGGQLVKIKGSGFVAGSKVKIGSEAAEVQVLSEGEIKARTTATAAGEDEVVVTNANGTSSLGPLYTYL